MSKISTPADLDKLVGDEDSEAITKAVEEIEKLLACHYNPATGEARFDTTPPTPSILLNLRQRNKIATLYEGSGWSVTISVHDTHDCRGEPEGHYLTFCFNKNPD